MVSLYDVSVNYDFRILMMSEKNHQFMHVYHTCINFVVMTEYIITVLFIHYLIISIVYR